MYLPSAVTKQAEIDAAIKRVEQAIGPDVVRIRYEIGEDWSGQWAIFFRIVLKDDAARRHLGDVAPKVVWGLPDNWTSRRWAYSRTTTSGASRNKPCCRNPRGPSR
jgi:hypothetical protein